MQPLPTLLRVTTLVLAFIGAVAAQPKTTTVQLPGGAIEAEREVPEDGPTWVMPVTPLPAYDEATAAARLVTLDRDVTKARDPIARAQALFARGTHFAAGARHERILEVTALLRGDESRQPAAKQAAAAEAARHKVLSTQASDRAISDFLTVVCERAERSVGAGCPSARALRTWPQLDEAMAHLAWVLALAKREPEAARVYQRIVDDFPRSRYAADAAVAVADQAFAQVDLVRAEKLYTQAQRARTPGLRGYARYKLGWVQFNLGRNDEAFASFAAVARMPATDRQLTMLTREARKELVRTYPGAAANALDTFEQIVPGHGLELLVRLGDRWLETGRHVDATAIFTEALRLAPLDPRQCAWQASVTRSAFATSEPQRIAAELAALHAALARVRKLRTVPTAELATCIDVTRELTTKLTVQLEREARATRSPGPLDLVDPLYAVMIISFPADAGAASMRGWRVEAAWQRAELERKDPRKFWLLVVTRCDEALQAKLETPARMKELVTIRGLARQRWAAAKPRP